MYGLGSIFVPILIIRWADYEPDTTHTMAMMVAALTGVIVWRLMGFNDEVFESIPGMGAAFITHFVMNKIRFPDLSPLGRYDWPDDRKTRAIAAALIIPFGAIEATYAISGPDSVDSTSGPSGDWIVEATFGSEQLADGFEYVNDGETIAIDMHSDSIEDAEDLNIVGVRVTLTYSEDETSTGIGCNAPGASNSDPDTITATMVHNENNATESGQNSDGPPSSHLVEVEWYNSSMIGNVSNVSRSQIIMGLDSGGVGLGAYALDISVTVETGGAIGCTHTDDGEDVEYLVELITLDYSIESA